MVTRVPRTSGKMALSCNQAKEWVKLHYEKYEEGVVAKSVMYRHYEDECRELGRPLMETSIFGRIVKSIFPDVNIRRLGGRDNLKYYYCGIQAKEGSKYYSDNATTTRPKRRLRKRELASDKMDVHKCLRWLHAHYEISRDNSVVKADVYESYVQYCIASNVEALSLQYFGMVVTHAFPNVTKRKLGPRTNQQKFYFGIQERHVPLSMEDVPSDFLNRLVNNFETNPPRNEYRTGLEGEFDEEDSFCPSPSSEVSELSPIGQDSHIDESVDLRHSYGASSLIKQERIEDNFSNIQLKDEPLEDESLDLNEYKPLDLSNVSYREVNSPERPPSSETYGSSSPSPPVKGSKPGRLYKPRFHFYYNLDKQNMKREKEDPSYDYSNLDTEHNLKSWISREFDESSGPLTHINREQVYNCYQKICASRQVNPLPLTYFDETMFKVIRGSATMIQHSYGNDVSNSLKYDKTFYGGVRLSAYSSLHGQVDEYETNEEDYSWGEEDNVNDHDSMDLSPSADSNPISLDEEEDEPPDEPLPLSYQMESDLMSRDILKDGKYYLRMWLTEHFEPVPNSCVLKSGAYKFYDDYAKSMNQTPFEMNVFGKIVRQVFPKVSIRRLGGRVKPQYHYCGIGVKTTSPLYQHLSGKDPAQRSRKKEIATDNRSAEIVIDWLRHNYTQGKDRIITKSEVFKSYDLYCKENNENPVTLNYFGKLVKHCFPEVEVRKFGGRSEPTWCYYGLIPTNASLSMENAGTSAPSLQDDYAPHDRRASLPVDLQIHMNLSRNIQSCHGIPASREEAVARIPQYSSSPIPISMNNSNGHIGTPGSFGSASVIVPPYILNQNSGLHHSPHVSHIATSYSHHHSPRDQDVYIIENRSRLSDSIYAGSPNTPHHNSFRETLGSQSPADCTTFKDYRRNSTRSPYESDVPPESIYSRSPGDAVAQISRSPNPMISHRYPTNAEVAQNRQNMPIPANETILFARSPEVVSTEIAQQMQVNVCNNGCQVVPSQTPPGIDLKMLKGCSDISLILQPHSKKHKGQLRLGDEYEMLRDMSFK